MTYMPSTSRTLGFNDLCRIRSAEDLFALAGAVEAEAYRRYDTFQRQMAEAGNTDLADLFAFLRDQEASHETRLSDLAQQTGLLTVPALTFQWDALPEGDMPEYTTDFTAQQVLRYALRNEQRTYALFLRIAAQTSDSHVREQAENLALEELNHVALLSRQELDLASEPPAATLTTLPQRRNIDSLRSLAASEALLSASRRAEEANHLRRKGDRISAALLQDLAEQSEARNRALGGPGNIPANPFGEEALHRYSSAANDNMSPGDILRSELRTTQLSVCGFLNLATQLGQNGLSAFSNHEADQRMGMIARLSDRLATLEHI